MQEPEQECHESSAMLPGQSCCCPGKDLGGNGCWTDSGCMRELCAWTCNAVERGHCQSTQERGRGPAQEALTGCPPARAGSITPQAPLSTYSHGSSPCTCPGQLSPRTPSGSPCGTWLPSGHSAGQSSSVGWGRTWGESQGREGLSSWSSTQAVSGQGCEQTFTPQIPGVSQNSQL